MKMGDPCLFFIQLLDIIKKKKKNDSDIDQERAENIIKSNCSSKKKVLIPLEKDLLMILTYI